jgi:menaquinol-cytochrome c reductase cytochrome b/c subunit
MSERVNRFSKRPLGKRHRQRSQEFARYKERTNREGKAFFPHAMFHDTVMSLVVVSVIVGLACVWYFTTSENPEDCGESESCLLGPRYHEEADPGTTSFVPRPDWYFYFLFYLLRIFKWPESVVLGTVGIPTILLILLFAIPFLDLRRERQLLRRPVAVTATVLVVISMGVLTYKGATAEEALGSSEELINEWVEANNLPEDARPGAELFAEAGCQSCHTYLGSGSSNLGAPDLTDVGARTGRGVDGFLAFLKDPPAPMAQFTRLGDENLRNISIFLDASRGEGGGG